MTRFALNLLRSASFAPALLAGLPSPTGAEGFIGDVSINLDLRSLHFDRDFHQPGAVQPKQEERAQDSLLQVKFGYTQGALDFGVELIGQPGLKLNSSPDCAGSGLLPCHADGRIADNYAQLGVVPKLKLSNTELKLGELLPELPTFLRNGGHLLPQTFQDGMLIPGEIVGPILHGGQMRSLSQRNSSDYQDLLVDGRSEVFSDRLDYLDTGCRFNVKCSRVELWQARPQNIYRQDYYSLNHKQSFGGWRLGASTGLFDTCDGGAAKLGNLENYALIGFFSATRGRHSPSADYQRMYDGDGMFYIVGTSTPLVNDIQVRNFTSAGERPWQLCYNYDFVALNTPGLTTMARCTSSAYARTKAMDDNRVRECDVDAAYVIQSGPLKNLGLRWRNTMLRSNHAVDVDENHPILSYPLPLL